MKMIGILYRVRYVLHTYLNIIVRSEHVIVI